MKWEKINIKSVIDLLRELEKRSLSLDGECAVIFTDEKEELRISYRRLK